MFDPLSVYSPANRTRLLLLAAVLVVVIATLDWWHPSYISLGFLYLFPIMVAGGVLAPPAIFGLAIVCAVLQEMFGDLPGREAVMRFVLSSAGFAGTGLFVWELVRGRRLVGGYVQELETQVRLRRDAEQQLRALVDSSPAAILTIGGDGQVLVANEAAQALLAPGGPDLKGQPVARYLPSLQAALDAGPARRFRTALQGRAMRHNGEVFLAAAWFSTYSTSDGPRLAAIVVDLSDELRTREDLSLDYLLRHGRIVMTAIAHEIRNLSGAILVVYRNLSRLPALARDEDFKALGTLVQGLEKLAEEELRPPATEETATLDLSDVLDELRVLSEATLVEHGIACSWPPPGPMPMVRADRNGLMQVFLNLARNSERALRTAPTRRLCVTATTEARRVVVRFTDTGPGVAHPEALFKPFRKDAGGGGLGLYVSRAIVRSFGGDLIYEPTAAGACFAVMLDRAGGVADA